jgi:hypothetical protein
MSTLDLVPIDQIAEQTLQALVSNGASESTGLEFKGTSYGNADDDKREFLKDVTALANTSGGHVIIGMAAVDGVATSLQPITTPSADQEKQRLENMLLAAVEPRLVGLQMREVSVTGGYVLVLRVPRSWNPPHRVTFKGLNRYFFRHSSGVYEPSVDQLRAVFLGGAERERQLLEFRLDRLSRLRTGERGPRVRGAGKLVVQVVPFVAQQQGFALPSAEVAYRTFRPPAASAGLEWFHNFEGLVIYSASGQQADGTTTYTQIFHTGAVELVRGGYVFDRDFAGATWRLIGTQAVMRDLFGSVARAVIGLLKCGAEAPFVVMISLLDAAGARLTVTDHDLDEARPLDRPDLLFAPVVVTADDLQGDWSARLAPIADSLWNAFGYETCHVLRDASGTWTGLPGGWR